MKKSILFMKRAAAGLVASAATAPAFADVPAAVTTKLEEGGADIGTLGAAVMVVIIGIAVWKYMRRAV
ncbi:major capsid protein [Aeromonas caviae]